MAVRYSTKTEVYDHINSIRECKEACGLKLRPKKRGCHYEVPRGELLDRIPRRSNPVELGLGHDYLYALLEHHDSRFNDEKYRPRRYRISWRWK